MAFRVFMCQKCERMISRKICQRSNKQHTHTHTAFMNLEVMIRSLTRCSSPLPSKILRNDLIMRCCCCCYCWLLLLLVVDIVVVVIIAWTRTPHVDTYREYLSRIFVCEIFYFISDSSALPCLLALAADDDGHEQKKFLVSRRSRKRRERNNEMNIIINFFGCRCCFLSKQKVNFWVCD